MTAACTGRSVRRAGGLLLALAMLIVMPGDYLAAQSQPPPPEDLEATAAGPTQVDLRWSPPERDENDGDDDDDFTGSISHYNVYRDGERVASTEETSFSDTEVEPDTRYTYRVTTVSNSRIESEPSEKAKATTPPLDTTPPTIPENLRTTAVESTRVDLAWSASSDPESGVDHYRVLRDGSGIGTTVDTLFSDTGLEAGTTYDYRVSAVNGDGEESGLSEAVSVTTDGVEEPDTVPPAPPTDLRVET